MNTSLVSVKKVVHRPGQAPFVQPYYTAPEESKRIDKVYDAERYYSLISDPEINRKIL